MKLKNPSIHGSKFMLCITKHTEYQSPKLQRAITHEVFFGIYSNVNQVIYSSLPIHSWTFKALASIVFEIFCCQDFIHFFFQRTITQKRGIILMRKKYVSASFHEKSYIWNFKIQAYHKACRVPKPKITKGHNS